MIDDRWLDIDFTKEERFTFGANERASDAFAGPSFSDTGIQLIPRSQWRSEIEKAEATGITLERCVSRIFDQGQEGSCVANATSQAHEICQAQQFGRNNAVLLSAISLYKRIGSSPNSGAMIDDALDEIRKGGILPLDNEENRRAFGGHVMPATGFHTRWPSGDWQSTARKFAGGEAFIIQDFDEMISVVLSGFPVVVGREGHSICYVRPTYDSRGNVVMKYANSWAPDWGESGYGYDSQRQIEKSAQWAFGLRTVTNCYANQFSFSV